MNLCQINKIHSERDYNKALKYIKEKWKELQGVMNKSVVIMREFNTCFQEHRSRCTQKGLLCIFQIIYLKIFFIFHYAFRIYVRIMQPLKKHLQIPGDVEVNCIVVRDLHCVFSLLKHIETYFLVQQSIHLRGRFLYACRECILSHFSAMYVYQVC